ncbi:MAG: hypothetical protein J1F36_04955, partial [Clostridiales bacterium]|nr:hypothetical protein [Clostridiales bacterium]
CMYEKSWAQEYYRVDLSLYYYPENEIGWCPDFFIEHENEHFEIDTNRTIKNKGWYGEFIKLLPLKCSDLGAKVIISYDDFKNLTNKVDFLCKVLNSEDSICRQSITDTPILIILGPSNKTIKEDSDVDFKIVLFTCKNGKWDCKCQTSVEMLGNSSIKGIFQRIHKEYKQ